MITKDDMMQDWVRAGMGGYTYEELKEAFEMVKPKRGWKFPISATVSSNAIGILSFAIPFFCGGGQPDFVEIAGGHLVEVYHPGYYNSVGA